MKHNKSTHSGKGKHWGKLTKKHGPEYNQVTSGAVSHSPAKKSGFFLGHTKGNKDLPIDRS